MRPDFYDDHPISAAHVLAAVRRARGGDVITLVADDLFPFDQDHYGGLAAVDTLARLAAIRTDSRVLDVCAGLAGPARFLAARRGCHVTALELHAGRAAGGARLTRLVHLDHRVAIVRADARCLPFRGAKFDACISQEALLHVEDKTAVLGEVHRVLCPDGRLAFTDWIAHRGLSDGERRRLALWMAAPAIESLAAYRTLLGRAGFRNIEAVDVTDEWRTALRARSSLFRALRPATIARVGEARYAEYAQLSAFFVGLLERGRLGGGRFSATA